MALFTLLMLAAAFVPFAHPADPSLVATVNVGGEPSGVVYDSGMGEIFVANFNSSTVSVISDSTNTVTSTISVGPEPQQLAYDSALGEVFVTEGYIVQVISDKTNTVVANITAGMGPSGIAYDSGKGELFVANHGLPDCLGHLRQQQHGRRDRKLAFRKLRWRHSLRLGEGRGLRRRYRHQQCVGDFR